MKATFTITYNPERTHELETVEAMQKGPAFKSVLFEFDNYLRNRLKYEDLPYEASKALEAAREKLWEELNDRDLKLFS